MVASLDSVVEDQQTNKMKATKEEFDQLVPDRQVMHEFNISAMALHRWDKDPELGFPPKIKIRKHNFRSRRQIEEFKTKLLSQAIKRTTAVHQRKRSAR
jgi:hypothetical protein